MFGSMFRTADQSVCIPLSASLSHHLAESPPQGQCNITRLFCRAYHIMKGTLTIWYTGWTQRPPDLYLTATQRTHRSLLTYWWYSRRKHETHEEEKRQTGRVGSCNVQWVIKSRYSDLCNEMVAKFWFDQTLPEGCYELETQISDLTSSFFCYFLIMFLPLFHHSLPQFLRQPEDNSILRGRNGQG